MTKQVTEDYFTSSFFLRLLEPYVFSDKYGNAGLIIAKRVIENEFEKNIDFTDGESDYSNFMRKQDSLAVILYATLSSLWGEPARNYLLPSTLPLKDKERIKLYGTKPRSEVGEFYKKIYNEHSGPIENEYHFFNRVDDLFCLPFNFNFIVLNIWKLLAYTRMDVAEEKVKSLVSNKEYLLFDITNPQYNLNTLLEQETQRQISFLKDFFKVTEGMPYAEEVSRTFQNVINFFFQKIFYKENLKVLINWEFRRLQLAQMIDSKEIEKKDTDKLIQFLLSAKPNPKKNLEVKIPESKTFTVQVRSIFEYFAKQNYTLGKAEGQIFASAQLAVVLGNRFSRQSEVTAMLLNSLDLEYKELKNKNSDEALKIVKVKAAAEAGLQKLAHTEILENFRINEALLQNLAWQLSTLEDEISQLEIKKSAIPPPLRFQQRILKKSISDLQAKLSSLEEKLNRQTSLSASSVTLMPTPMNSQSTKGYTGSGNIPSVYAP